MGNINIPQSGGREELMPGYQSKEAAEESAARFQERQKKEAELVEEARQRVLERLRGAKKKAGEAKQKLGGTGVEGHA